LSGTPSRKDHLASEVGKPALRAWLNNQTIFLDNLNFDLGCPNDY
jgi:hypothetical protein